MERYKPTEKELALALEKACAHQKAWKGPADMIAAYITAFIAGIEYVKQSTPPTGAVWVKASERLPDGRGNANSVIIKSDGFPKDKFGHGADFYFVTEGFVNFDKDHPTFYFTLGSHSYLTNENIYWLDERPAPSPIAFAQWVGGDWIWNGDDWTQRGAFTHPIRQTTEQLYQQFFQQEMLL